MRDWRSLRGKTVSVDASGTSYRGRVVEMGETSLVLRTPGGFCEIPWERITKIDEVEPGRETPPGPARGPGPMPEGWN